MSRARRRQLASAPVRNAFLKGHGLGNDYLVVDPSELDSALDAARVRRAVRPPHRGRRRRRARAHARARRRLRPAHLQPRRQRGGEVGKRPAHLRALSARDGGRAAPRSRSRRPAVWSASSSRSTRTASPRAPRRDGPRELPAAPTAVQPRRRGARRRADPRRMQSLRFTGVSVGNPHCVVFRPRGRDVIAARAHRARPRARDAPDLPALHERTARGTAHAAPARGVGMGARRGRDAVVGVVGLRGCVRGGAARPREESDRGGDAGRLALGDGERFVRRHALGRGRRGGPRPARAVVGARARRLAPVATPQIARLESRGGRHLDAIGFGTLAHCSRARWLSEPA